MPTRAIGSHRWHSAWARLADPLHLVALGPAVALLAVAFVFPPQIHGDAGEYLLMLESWATHGSPDVRPGDIASLRVSLGTRSGEVDVDRVVLPNYFPGRSGRLYCYHFWGYSLAGWPARVLLPRLGLDALRALPVTNALALGAALAGVLTLLPWPASRRLLLAGLLAFSPGLALLLWPHPEVLAFAFAVLSLVAAARGAWNGALALAGMAAIQNPPLLLLALVVGAFGLVRAWRLRSPLAWARLVVAAIPGLVPATFYLWQYGVINRSVPPQDAAADLSWSRGIDLLFDPNLGMLVHAPVALALALAAAARALAVRRLWAAPTLLAALFGMLVACTACGNWNTDTAGPSRYVSWLFALVGFAAIEADGRPSAPVRRWAVVALVLGITVQAGVVLGRGGPLAPSDYLRHSWPARFVLDRWPGLYNPAPQVFVERTLHHERAFQGPVIYRDAAGRCRKAWVQWRQADLLASLCGPPPPAAAKRLAVNAVRKDLKRDWTYIDY